MRIAVVGSGVSGLTCAVRLAEAGARVTIVTREPPGRTTSAVAGAVWFPYRVRPNERTGPWGRAGYERFEALSGRDGMPVTMVELTALYPDPLPDEPWWLSAVPGDSVRMPRPSELPDGYADGRIVRVPCIEAAAYLDWLARRFAELGGELEVREVASLDEPEADVVVNCSGVGARRLTGDEEIRPVRGQVAYVRTRERLRFMVDETGPNALAYVLPRPDVVVLGGTAEEDDWEPRARPETTRSILHRTRLLDPRLADAELVGVAVGLRPARSEVRLEADALPDGRLLVHDYGHGGSGFTLSWGCADEVARIVEGSRAA
ncbi:MAG TPA: FAD-dependent oxidoreductase [Thermoleophilaceae bacterium]|jgi:D-amino-acid oxidase